MSFETATSHQPAVVIVCPVYNDWESFRVLVNELQACLSGHCSAVTIVAVDDGSPNPPPDRIELPLGVVARVEVVELAVNLGHQRAIAVGLAHASRCPLDCVVVMDSDGEDTPEGAVHLLTSFAHRPGVIHVVERGRRSEPFRFRVFYVLYRMLFGLCTGARIKHGNFCLLPARQLIGLLHSTNTWNNLAASIVRSKMSFQALSLDRGHRYTGKSKMAFTSLLIHGLSAVSVYFDVMAARLLVFCFLLLMMLTALVFAVVGVRLFSDLAVPGWATYTVGLLTILITQIVLFAASVLFTLLHNRGQSSAVPAKADEVHAVAVRVLYRASAA